MRYNLQYDSCKSEAFLKLKYFSEQKYIIELKRIEETRSTLQNNALHLYFKHVADALNEVGYDYVYVNPIHGDFIHIPFTTELVKSYIWKPLQEKMFEIESTTKLTTKMINDILEVLSLWLGEKNQTVTFPNRIDLLMKRADGASNF